MLRLASRSSAAAVPPSAPSSPARVRTFAQRAASTPPRPLAAQQGPAGWQPGDPIVFAGSSGSGLSGGRRESSPTAGREWSAGDPIVFGGEGARTDGRELHGAQAEHRSPVRKAPRTSTPTSMRRAASSAFATYASPSSSRSASPFPSRSTTSASWLSTTNRWEPPSPSLSSQVDISSQSSTALFDPERSYAQIRPLPLASPSVSRTAASEQHISRSVSYGSLGAVDEHGFGRAEVGVQAGASQLPHRALAGVNEAPALSQAEMDDLVSGVDFDDELELDAGCSGLTGQSSLAQSDLEALVEGIDFSQEVELSDDGEPFYSAVTTPSDSLVLPAAATPPRPVASPPQQVDDLFTPSRHPPSPSAARAPSPRVPLRSIPPTSSPLRPITRTPILPPSPSADPVPLRAYSTATAFPARPTSTAPDSDDELVAPAKLWTAASAPAAAAAGPQQSAAPRVIELSDSASDDEVEILRGGKPADACPRAKAKVSGGSGWFQRRTPVSSSSSAAVPGPSSFARTKPALAAAAAVPTTRARRAPKREAEAAKQLALREKWPRVFSYRDWSEREVEVVYTRDEAEVERVLARLEGPVGFDLEWDPYVPRKGGLGGPGKAALVQVCDASTILLVHVAKMPRFPAALKRFVEDPDKIKLGVQVAGDAAKLKRDFGHNPRGTLELNALVRQYDAGRFVGRLKPGLIGLQELTGIYLDCYLPKEKDVRCARWSGALSQEQIEYAANDVYASLHILFTIQSLANVPPESSHDALLALSAKPYNSFYGFNSRPATTDGGGTTYKVAPLPPTPAPASGGKLFPKDVLPPRKLEAFELFHEHALPLDDIVERMSAQNPIKPLSVVWNLLEIVSRLRRTGVDVDWDVPKLVRLVDESAGTAKDRMLAEHGALVEELRGQLREG
ncbi:uncharacterized protein JCM10292_003370 [Rhodotorula paludigena]|uniref:uncharacterized protein n=1 Tax=Rhodotorula paludigena TaxID=86838 RepID=UPI003171C654